ncbi:MAG: hypothetical protein ACQER9_01905 [Nanobdellota archaeon]
MNDIINEGIFTLINNGLPEIITFGLIFSIVYGVERKVGLFIGSKPENDDDKIKKWRKKFKRMKSTHAVIALVLGLLSIIPHYVSSYSAYDIVPIIGQIIPKFGIIGLAILSVLILFGLLGFQFRSKRDEHHHPFKLFIFLAIVGLVVWAVGDSMGRWVIPSWIGSELVAVALAILVFGLIVSFVMGPSSKKKKWADLFEGEGEGGNKTFKGYKNAKLMDAFNDFLKNK